VAEGACAALQNEVLHVGLLVPVALQEAQQLLLEYCERLYTQRHSYINTWDFHTTKSNHRYIMSGTVFCKS